MDRPSWHSYFLQIATAVAARSTCDRARVGCVLVRDRRILTTGFNGAPAGLPHCDNIGHLMTDGHCVRTVHAEANSIVQAALHGVTTVGATAYITHFPCLACAYLLANAGIRQVVFQDAYRVSEATATVFALLHIEVIHAC